MRFFCVAPLILILMLPALYLVPVITRQLSQCQVRRSINGCDGIRVENQRLVTENEVLWKRIHGLREQFGQMRENKNITSAKPFILLEKKKTLAKALAIQAKTWNTGTTTSAKPVSTTSLASQTKMSNTGTTTSAKPLSTTSLASQTKTCRTSCVGDYLSSPYSNAGSWVRVKLGQNTSPHLYSGDIPRGGSAGDGDRKYKPTPGHPFREETMWEWKNSEDDCCPLSRLTRKNLCKGLRLLKIKRLLMVGDSISFMQWVSMWMLLEIPHPRGSFDYWYQPEHRLDCADGQEFILLKFVRNDDLNTTAKVINVNTNLQQDWVSVYAAGSNSTLLVINAGAHIRNIRHFRATLDTFVDQVAAVAGNWQRRGDRILFRSSYVGHPNCGNSTVSPRPYSLAEFKESVNPRTKFPFSQWGEMLSYDSILRDLFSRPTIRQKINISVLDISLMTNLRPDGHCYLSPNFDRVPDCLHYYLPGPPDWWNHLMVSQLLGMQ